MTTRSESLASDYVDWVEEVATAAVAAASKATPDERLLGVPLDVIAHELSAEMTDDVKESLTDAVKDLERLGLLEFRDHRSIKLSQEGRKLSQSSLASAWPQVFDVYLDDEQEEALCEVVRLSQSTSGGYPTVQWVEATEWMPGVGVDWIPNNFGIGYALARALEESGMLVTLVTAGGGLRVYPTYCGVVRATRRRPSELFGLMRDLLAQWETINVDFKRELNVDSESGKAEFVRDALALANTQVTGRRFLVIGFDDSTREHTHSVSESVTQERLEKILHSWCERPPEIALDRVAWGNGEAGLIEL